jgi:hypothetical protein
LDELVIVTVVESLLWNGKVIGLLELDIHVYMYTYPQHHVGTSYIITPKNTKEHQRTPEEHQKNTRRTPEEHQKNTRRTPEEHQKNTLKNT